jgi:hypothetical protein
MHAHYHMSYKDSQTMTLVREFSASLQEIVVKGRKQGMLSLGWCSCACDSPQHHPPVCVCASGMCLRLDVCTCGHEGWGRDDGTRVHVEDMRVCITHELQKSCTYHNCQDDP